LAYHRADPEIENTLASAQMPDGEHEQLLDQGASALYFFRIGGGQRFVES
jgi:hypothetical protein